MLLVKSLKVRFDFRSENYECSFYSDETENDLIAIARIYRFGNDRYFQLLHVKDQYSECELLKINKIHEVLSFIDNDNVILYGSCNIQLLSK